MWRIKRRSHINKNKGQGISRGHWKPWMLMEVNGGVGMQWTWSRLNCGLGQSLKIINLGISYVNVGVTEMLPSSDGSK